MHEIRSTKNERNMHKYAYASEKYEIYVHNKQYA